MTVYDIFDKKLRRGLHPTTPWHHATIIYIKLSGYFK